MISICAFEFQRLKGCLSPEPLWKSFNILLQNQGNFYYLYFIKKNSELPLCSKRICWANVLVLAPPVYHTKNGRVFIMLE